MGLIAYNDKQYLNNDTSIADENKAMDTDFNNIKKVTNDTITGMGIQNDTWSDSGTYSTGDLVVFENKIYENLTGTNSTTTPDLDTTNWAIVPLFVGGVVNYKLSKGKILWVNPNPNADFAEQTITLNSDEFDIYEVVGRSDISQNGKWTFSTRALKGTNTRLVYCSLAGIRWWGRDMYYRENASIEFKNCYYFDISTSRMTNDLCVPLYIIGYKM